MQYFVKICSFVQICPTPYKPEFYLSRIFTINTVHHHVLWVVTRRSIVTPKKLITHTVMMKLWWHKKQWKITIRIRKMNVGVTLPLYCNICWVSSWIQIRHFHLERHDSFQLLLLVLWTRAVFAGGIRWTVSSGWKLSHPYPHIVAFSKNPLSHSEIRDAHTTCAASIHITEVVLRVALFSSREHYIPILEVALPLQMLVISSLYCKLF